MSCVTVAGDYLAVIVEADVRVNKALDQITRHHPQQPHSIMSINHLKPKHDMVLCDELQRKKKLHHRKEGGNYVQSKVTQPVICEWLLHVCPSISLWRWSSLHVVELS